MYDFETSTAATWGAMEACQQAGLTRAAGLSNFNERQIAELEAVATIQPAVLQVESHPFFAQESLLKFCLERGIVFEAYSPLAAGGRSKRRQSACLLLCLLQTARVFVRPACIDRVDPFLGGALTHRSCLLR